MAIKSFIKGLFVAGFLAGATVGANASIIIDPLGTIPGGVTNYTFTPGANGTVDVKFTVGAYPVTDIGLSWLSTTSLLGSTWTLLKGNTVVATEGVVKVLSNYYSSEFNQFLGVGSYTLEFSNQSIKGDNLSLVVTAIPEPATWALMVVGFAAVGFVAYRRRSGASFRLA